MIEHNRVTPSGRCKLIQNCVEIFLDRTLKDNLQYAAYVEEYVRAQVEGMLDDWVREKSG